MIIVLALLEVSNSSVVMFLVYCMYNIDESNCFYESDQEHMSTKYISWKHEARKISFFCWHRKCLLGNRLQSRIQQQLVSRSAYLSDMFLYANRTGGPLSAHKKHKNVALIRIKIYQRKVDSTFFWDTKNIEISSSSILFFLLELFPYSN